MNGKVTGKDERLATLGGALARMQVHESSFTAIERRLAEAFRANGRELIGLSGDEVAERLGISKPSVIRFCRRLGYSGLREFKLALAAEVRDDPDADATPIGIEDSFAAIVQKVTAAAQRALADSRDVLDPHALERATGAFRLAVRIQLFGVGGSAAIAQDAHYRFARLGLPVAVVTDAHLQPVVAANLGPSDVAFVVSHTGRSREPVEVLNQAKQAGATTILLTSYANTPAARRADIVLLTAPMATAPWGGMAPLRVAQLTVIDMLCVAIVGRDPARQRYREQIDALLESNAVAERDGMTRPNAGEAGRRATSDDPRLVTIDGVENARHLGGFRLAEGDETAPVVIRSGLLADITPSGIADLSRLGVTAVVDLRTVDDCREFPTPDLSAAGIEVIFAPMADLRDVPYPDIDDEAAWIEIYWDWIAGSQPAMRQLVETIAGTPGTVLMHCHLGMDRTGIASALLLDLLDVSLAAITDDYALSPGSAGLDYLLPANLLRVRERWGSTAGYFQEAGVTEEVLLRVRERFLVQ